jgi:glucan phosphoethanolaminetransferase (alkaline phosphatase superfamily)
MSHNAPARPVSGVRTKTNASALTGYLLRICTAAALIIDAVIHWRDAPFYDSAGPGLSQGELFRIQAVVAIVVAIAVLVWPRRGVWVIAFLVAASAVGAAVLYTYVNVGSLAGLPNMYEPSWSPSGKALSAIAEGAGALFALAGLAWSIHRRRAS